MSKFSRLFSATLIFLIMLISVYYLHISFFKVNVVFYASIADGFIAVLISAFFLWAWTFFNVLDNFEKLLIIIIWLLLGYSWAISVPTVIDRSLSFYILEKLQQRGGGIKLESIKDVFIYEYIPEHRLMDVRLTEQIESGTIEIKNDCVKLTAKGNNIATFGRFFRNNFLPKQRLLLGEYTDDLTNPFRKDVNQFIYQCQ